MNFTRGNKISIQNHLFYLCFLIQDIDYNGIVRKDLETGLLGNMVLIQEVRGGGLGTKSAHFIMKR